MQPSTKRVIGSILATTIFLSAATFSGTPAIAEGGDWGEWKEKEVGIGGWSKAPGTNVWSDLPTLGNDGFIYSYEPVCFRGDVGDVRCLDANACTEGPSGQYVLWKRALRVNPPEWQDFPNNGPTCVYSENPEELLEEVTARLLSEFQEHPVAAGEVTSQPGPHTMIGAETNVYVDSQVQVINTVILGQSITITATPTEYLLHYGDGTTGTLSFDPGSPLPESGVGQPTATSHVYTSTGDFEMYATVYFTAVYSMNGGPEVSIDGRGIFDTPTEPISVWKSDTRNVADDCLANPAGYGC